MPTIPKPQLLNSLGVLIQPDPAKADNTSKGRCDDCAACFVWRRTKKLTLRNADCPCCGRPLRQTTHNAVVGVTWWSLDGAPLWNRAIPLLATKSMVHLWVDIILKRRDLLLAKRRNERQAAIDEAARRLDEAVATDPLGDEAREAMQEVTDLLCPEGTEVVASNVVPVGEVVDEKTLPRTKLSNIVVQLVLGL